MLIQVGAGAKGGGAVGTGVGLLTAVGASVLGEAGCNAETLAADPAAERPQTRVDSLVVLEMRQLAETFPTRGALEDGRRTARKRKEDKCAKY